RLVLDRLECHPGALCSHLKCQHAKLAGNVLRPLVACGIQPPVDNVKKGLVEIPGDEVDIRLEVGLVFPVPPVLRADSLEQDFKVAGSTGLLFVWDYERAPRLVCVQRVSDRSACRGTGKRGLAGLTIRVLDGDGIIEVMQVLVPFSSAP